jgi:hypothetical protein
LGDDDGLNMISSDITKVEENNNGKLINQKSRVHWTRRRRRRY